jgi:cell division cycle 14
MIKASQVIEIIPRRLYWLCDKTAPTKSKSYVFSTDDTYTYIPYNNDFGPLDISLIVKYCRTLESLLRNPKYDRQPIYHYSSVVPAKRANSALLICAYQVLILKRSPDKAWQPFSEIPRFLPFRDASSEQNKFELHIFDCLTALEKALNLNWLDVENFDIDEYLKNSDPVNGGFNWIVPEKIIAFPCPSSRTSQNSTVTLILL